MYQLIELPLAVIGLITILFITLLWIDYRDMQKSPNKENDSPY